MTLYLLRHGKAEKHHPQGEESRELTDYGFEQARRMGRFLEGRLSSRLRILVSPYTRAQQTARVFAEAAGMKDVPRETRNCLTPLEEPETVMAEIAAEEDPAVLLVGHNPHLSQLASLLLWGRPGRLALETASLVVLDWPRGAAAGDGELEALIPSRMVRA